MRSEPSKRKIRTNRRIHDEFVNRSLSAISKRTTMTTNASSPQPTDTASDLGSHISKKRSYGHSPDGLHEAHAHSEKEGLHGFLKDQTYPKDTTEEVMRDKQNRCWAAPPFDRTLDESRMKVEVANLHANLEAIVSESKSMSEASLFERITQELDKFRASMARLILRDRNADSPLAAVGEPVSKESPMPRGNATKFPLAGFPTSPYVSPEDLCVTNIKDLTEPADLFDDVTIKAKEPTCELLATPSRKKNETLFPVLDMLDSISPECIGTTRDYDFYDSLIHESTAVASPDMAKHNEETMATYSARQYPFDSEGCDESEASSPLKDLTLTPVTPHRLRGRGAAALESLERECAELMSCDSPTVQVRQRKAT